VSGGFKNDQIAGHRRIAKTIFQQAERNCSAVGAIASPKAESEENP
jgi:hypothetical protein